MSLLVLPNQLYSEIPPHINKLILYEHPDFFVKYNYNRIKLVFHRATMRNYAQEMKKKYIVKYVEFDEDPPNADYMFYQPNKIQISRVKIIPSPNFLCLHLFEEYRAKTDKFVFNNFYMWMKNKLGIIPDVKSTDKYNRNKMPLNKLNSVPKDKCYKVLDDPSFFKGNPGPARIDTLLFPLTRQQAKQHARWFVHKKLAHFGEYQDAIVDGEHTLYHSCLSGSLNIGLIHPSELIKMARPLHAKHKNSVEAFIRQLFWREYQLYCYNYMKLSEPNWGVSRKTLTAKWYDGTVGVAPIDSAIIKAFDTGYLHHIERLMIMGNFMLLYGIPARAAFKWFMEFSVDAYEWVMRWNVYGMVYGAGSMRRLYISSSNYILKMSNIPKGEWCAVWDDLYRTFLKKNKGHIGYPYE